jgi:PAS domain-containing protein
MRETDWAGELPAAITLIDCDGVVRYMNQRACETFAAEGGEALVGSSVYACHPEAAQQKIRQFMRTRTPNHYTISKQGKRKIIHQLPWFQDGAFAGLIELSVPLPDTLPHFERS